MSMTIYSSNEKGEFNGTQNYIVDNVLFWLTRESTKLQVCKF